MHCVWLTGGSAFLYNYLLQNSTAIDEDFGNVHFLCSIDEILHMHIPYTLFTVPVGSGDHVVEIEVARKVVEIHYILEVLQNLWSIGVVVRPMWILCPGELDHSQMLSWILHTS